MKIRNLGMFLLAVWLIATGLQSFGLNFPNEGVLLAIVAVAAGILVLLDR
ncbi:MAG: hypothetical protein HY257_01200 [Chloroflexi bacterium]|nr:hypothetical protein [Chloroflexota bacterium]